MFAKLSSKIYNLYIHFWRPNMKATVVDLRYKMTDVIKALERNEKVTVLYHGKVKGVIVPMQANKQLRVKDHPFFGMTKGSRKSVLDELADVRKSRY
jgi:hypothetical protein